MVRISCTARRSTFPLMKVVVDALRHFRRHAVDRLQVLNSCT
jgi:hypothetical protein